MPRVEDVRAAEGDLVDKLTEACKYRTTSRLPDQTFCLASIAGFDVHEIVEPSTHEQKMKIFLLQIRDLPNRIIFFKGPKMSLDNFFLGHLYPFCTRREHRISLALTKIILPARLCTPHGLQGRWPGFLLRFPATAGPHIDLYYFMYGDSWMMISSIDLMQRKSHSSTPSAEDISLWQQFHAVPRAGLIVHSLDPVAENGNHCFGHSYGVQSIDGAISVNDSQCYVTSYC